MSKSRKGPLFVHCNTCGTDNLCYNNRPLMTPVMFVSAKTATKRSLSSSQLRVTD